MSKIDATISDAAENLATPVGRHAKGQHDSICAGSHDGWCSVRVADEAPAWRFSQRLGD